MPTNYTGNPSGVHAPSSAPGQGVAAVVVVPLDGEAGSSASVTEAMEVPADFITFVTQSVVFSTAWGDASDGSVTLDGAVAAPSWASKNGTVYTMTRDASLV